MKPISLKEILKAYSVVLVAPVVLILCMISISSYTKAKEQMKQTEQEVIELRNQVDIYKRNKELVQSDLDIYNDLLLSIIPNKEDYFTIILSLEKLSIDTGFKIDKYVILLSQSNANKLALSVEGTGDPISFLKFLQQYQFEGGRLITNEKMEFSTANVGQTKLSLNFYNKPLTQTEQKIQPIKAKDINVIKDIQQKVAIQYTGTTDEENIQYETKQNPF